MLENSPISPRQAKGRLLIYGATILLLAIVLLYLIHNRNTVGRPAAMSSSAGYDTRIGRADPANTYKLVIATDGISLDSGASKFVVAKDSSVRIDIIAKGEEARLKLDGYDIITESSPEAPGAFSFVASQTGIFHFYALSELQPGEENEPAQTYMLGTVEVR